MIKIEESRYLILCSNMGIWGTKCVYKDAVYSPHNIRLDYYLMLKLFVLLGFILSKDT